MKTYPKEYADISRQPSDAFISRIGSSLGSADDLAVRFRSFYREVHPILFDFIIKHAWLEQHFLFNGMRRVKRSGNGNILDWAFSYFMKALVGISQKPLTDGIFFSSVQTYIKDFFPNFTDHDPFEEPEFFKYPYKHVTLDHLAFVYQCHNRLELLDEAEKRSMNIRDFMNWATNWMFCYNNDVDNDGKEYCLVRFSFIPYIKRKK